MKTTDEVRDKMAGSFSMDNADDRKQLIAALQEKGIIAHEIISSELVFVSVQLTPETATEDFSIDAVADICNCRVGVTGWRLAAIDEDGDEDYVDCLMDEACVATSLAEAVRAGVFLWGDRENLLAKFRAGQYDLPVKDQKDLRAYRSQMDRLDVNDDQHYL